MPSKIFVLISSVSLPEVMSVPINPGVTQLTRIPSAPNSRAIALASPRTPAFAAE
jgi:hypothetical protein